MPSAPGFLLPYIISLFQAPVRPKRQTKPKSRRAPAPPLSILTHPNPPKPPTLHKFTHKLPSYLNNVIFLRNGAGTYSHPHKSGPPWKANHLFDGLAVTHSIAIFTYPHSMAVHSSAYVDDQFTDTISNTTHNSFSPVQIYHPTTIPRSIKLFQFDPTGHVLYNLPVCHEYLPTIGTVARSDVSTFQTIDPLTLTSGKRMTFREMDSRLWGQMSASHGTTKDGYYYNFVSDLFSHKVFSISPTGETRILARVRSKSGLIHSIISTDNYLIMALCPYAVDIPKFVVTKSISNCVRDLPQSASFVLLDRHRGGVAAEFYTDPFFMFHFINAYEEGDDVVIDTCAYENADVIQQFKLDSIAKEVEVDSGMPTRFTLKGVSKATETYPRGVEAERYEISEASFEYPVVNPNFYGRKNRYAYGTGDCSGEKLLGEMIKLDTRTGDVTRWSEPGVFIGEAVFVASPDGREEDGVLLVTGCWEEETGGSGSALFVIDAKSMKEVSRAELGFSAGLGFHASIFKC